MPAVSSFYGIIVYMYFFDTDRHQKPHIHVQYSGQEVLIEIPNGEILSGKIPRNKMKLIQAWIVIHQDELMDNWHLGQERHPVNPIEPLKQLKMDTQWPKIIQAIVKKNHQILLTFDNGEKRMFDISPYLKNFFSELKDPQYFKKVFVVNGSIAWPNGQDLAYDMLYYKSSPLTISSSC